MRAPEEQETGGKEMNKADLVKKVSERTSIPSSAAKVIVSTIFEEMRVSLQKGDRIEIRGFGSFVARQYGAYRGRNPKTGTVVDVAPKRLPHFKVGRELRDLVNKQQG
jgi:integration host factor subunit beta